MFQLTALLSRILKSLVVTKVQEDMKSPHNCFGILFALWLESQASTFKL